MFHVGGGRNNCRQAEEDRRTLSANMKQWPSGHCSVLAIGGVAI